MAKKGPYPTLAFYVLKLQEIIQEELQTRKKIQAYP